MPHGFETAAKIATAAPLLRGYSEATQSAKSCACAAKVTLFGTSGGLGPTRAAVRGTTTFNFQTGVGLGPYKHEK